MGSSSEVVTRVWSYYGTIAGGYRRGPLHTLTRVEVANEVLWSGTLLRSASTNPVLISIPGRGTLELYWGTEDQVLSDWFNNLSTSRGHAHPAYRGVCFVVLRHMLFGEGALYAPNIRLSGLRECVQSLITGAATALIDGQVNPWVALAELYTDPLGGLGHPLDLFDQPSWQAVADACIPRAPEVYVSLSLTDRVSARTLGASLLAMCGGFVRPKRGTGRLEAGMWPDPSTINVSSLPVINSHILMGEVEAEPETWDDVKFKTAVTFKNRENLYANDVREYSDPRARRHASSRTPLKLELPIVRPEQAVTQSRLNGRLRALPGAYYPSVPFRGPALPLLQPGQHVRLDIDATPGGTQLLQVCRINSITRSFSSREHIAELEAERTLAPLAYTPAEEPGTPPTDEVPAVEHARLFELSPQAADGDDAAVALLCERPGPLVTDLFIRYDSVSTTGATYPELSRTGGFALRAALVSSVLATDTTLVLSLPGSLDREIADASPGPVAARNDALLLVLIGALDTTGGIYNRPVEIVSVLDLAVTATNQLTVVGFRARLGTAALALAAGVEAWFVRRDDLPWFRHADFPAKVTSGDLLYFKLQPATARQARPLDEITATSFRFNSVRAFAPVITPTGPANDTSQSYVSCALNDELTFTGAVTDADANLASLTVVLVNGGAEEVLYSRTYGGVASATYAAKRVFPTTGIFQIIVRATDDTGRTTEHTHNIHAAVSSTARCAEPTFEEIGTDQIYDAGAPYEASFTWWVDYVARIRCASMASEGGSSSTVKIHYAVVTIGTPLESVTWNTVEPANAYVDADAGESSGQVANSDYHYGYNTRVWAKAVDTAAILADSYPVYRDFDHG